MKICSKCKEERPTSEFPKRAASKDGLLGMCKACKRAYDKAHYKSNEDRRTYIRKNQARRREAVREWVREYLLTHPCVDCDEADIVVLEFDHRGDKDCNVALLLNLGGLEKVQAEIAKCDVRCANCHRRKTARDFGSWRLPV